MANFYICSNSLDPFFNLALEEVLFDSHESGVTLYLWQNRDTVVIGKNQNAWKECNMELLQEEGVTLARRLTGGGAVFHDLGNVNFTFITKSPDYNLARQLGVILSAVRSFGVNAEYTGRNDITLLNGSKFSGNAFRFSGETNLHHGSILVQSDIGRLSQYLSPSKAKLNAKGVDSVKSRVTNLSDASNGAITVSGLTKSLISEFIREYGPAPKRTVEEYLSPSLETLKAKYASFEWRIKKNPKCDLRFENRFPFGELEILLSIENNFISDVLVYSDAMDETLANRLERSILGLPLRSDLVAQAVRAIESSSSEEIAEWIKNMLSKNGI